MKKLLVVVCGLCVLALSTNAQDAKEKKAENSAVRKELIAKYDTNKDGKLDKAEKAKMTPEDKEKWAKVASHSKKQQHQEKSDSESK